MKDADGLTPKQAAFVREYLIDLNGTQAAIRAGYSETGANVTGVRLLSNPNVAAAVSKAQTKRAEKAGVDAAWVLRRLQEEAEYFDLGCSHSARVTAIGLVGKHLGMLADRVQHEGKDGGAFQVQVLSYRGTKLEDLGE